MSGEDKTVPVTILFDVGAIEKEIERRLIEKFGLASKRERRKPREWWVNPLNGILCETLEHPKHDFLEWTKVREVLDDEG